MDRRTFLQGLMAPLIAAGAIPSASSVTPAFAAGEQASCVTARRASTRNKWVGVSRFVCTGFPDLDSCLGELRDGMSVAIVGRPSMGKTSLALAVAAHVAVRLRRPVAIFGAPLSEQEIRARMIAFLARVDLWWGGWQLKSLPAGPATQAARALAIARLLIDDRPSLNTEDLATKVLWNNAQSGLRNGLIVILAPERIQVAAKGRGNLPECAPLMGTLHDLGETYGGAILCELPLGRAVEVRDDKSPRLTDLEGFSREFVRDADAVLLIDRPIIHDQSAEPDIACIFTALNRYDRHRATMLAFEYNGGFANYRWHDHKSVP